MDASQPSPRKLGDHPVSKLLKVLGPALITGFVATHKAHVDAKARVAEAHIEAEAGYTATVVALRQLEVKTSDALDRVSRLEGEVQILANHLDAHTSSYTPVRPPRVAQVVPSAREALGKVEEAAPAPVRVMQMPVNLEQAVDWSRGKK